MNKITMAPTATVREAKAQLSRYLEQARIGRATIITSRGRAIAQLMPLPGRRSHAVSAKEALEAMDLEGLSEGPESQWSPSRFMPVRPKSGFSISDAVGSMRR